MLMTWSLGVEEQFYLLFPLLLGWIWVLGRRKLLLSLAALSMVSFAVSIFQVSFYPSASFFLLTSRWWELGLGTILGIYEVSRAGQEDGGLSGLEEGSFRSSRDPRGPRGRAPLQFGDPVPRSGRASSSGGIADVAFFQRKLGES